MTHTPIFQPYEFGGKEKALLDKDGHVLLPGILTPAACERLMSSFCHIQDLTPSAVESHKPNHYAAEYDSYLESLIPHPQILDLAQRVLGKEIRFDHCVTIIRPGGNGGTGWHSHEYAEDDPILGFVRIFFYVNGFKAGDGGLKAVPGSHLYRDAKIKADTGRGAQDGVDGGKDTPHDWGTAGDPGIIRAVGNGSFDVDARCARGQSETRK